MPSYLDTLFNDRTCAILAVDPDDTRTALCLCVAGAGGDYQVTMIDGGGVTRASVGWGSITGALSTLRGIVADLGTASTPPTLVVEAQTAQGAHSASVEGCRRARWHWDAAAELLGWERVHVLPGDWEQAFVPAGSQWRQCVGSGKGAIKRAYQIRAREIDERACNEDRAAALGMAWWYAREIGATLRGQTSRG